MDREAGRTLRNTATAVLFIGIIVGISWIGIWLNRGHESEVMLPVILQAIFFVSTGIGFWGVLRGLAAVLEKPAPQPPAPVVQSSDGMDEVQEMLVMIRQQLEALPEQLKHALPPAGDQAQQAGAPQPSPGDPEVFRRIITLLEEIRETTLMTETQRQQRLGHMRQQKKMAMIQKVSHHIRHQQWAAAEEALASLETHFAGDTDVAKARAELKTGRDRTEAEAFKHMHGRVQDAIAVASWDTALKIVSQFAENFPGNADGQKLLEHVTRERDIFHDSTIHKMYEEVKYDLERKNWRRALAAAQRLLEKFPDHRKAEKIRAQLATIQENAEIEERQEGEARIQELIRGKRYGDAIDLAESLLQRFPASATAEALEELIPKLRQKAIQEEADSMIQ